MRRRCTLVIAGCASLATSLVAGAQITHASVHGVIFDSIRARPLAGATVALVNVADRTHIASSATSDSLGQYAFADVEPGRYIAGFMHPMLDSLGLSVNQAMLNIAAASDLAVDLALPSPIRLHHLICGDRSPDSTGVVIGFVLRAHDRSPIAGATILARWTEISIGGGVRQDIIARVGRSAVDGWFAVCGVPSAAEVVLSAIVGADSSGPIAIEVPGTRVARRTIFVGERGAPGAPAAALAPVRGWIRTEDGVPIGGASVWLHGSDSVAVTDADGAFSFMAERAGTQTLLVRALGFIPDERPVDVTTRDMPVIVGLTSIRQFLDTVHVRAAAIDPSTVVGFESRRRMGSGRFFAEREIARLGARQITDLFRHAPSMQLVSGPNNSFRLRMRGDASDCTPAIFLDGKQLIHWELADLNGLVQPETVLGVELYTASMTPAQFVTRDACGAVVVWTKAVRASIR